MAESRPKCRGCKKRARPKSTFCSNKCRQRFNAKKHYHEKVKPAGINPSSGKPFQKGEPEVVRGKSFALLLNEWKLWYEKKYQTEHHDYTTVVPMFGPVAWLEHETGINQKKLYRLLNAEYKIVPVSLVDAILTAIGWNYLLVNKSIKTIKNPKWSQEDWVAYMQERGCW